MSDALTSPHLSAVGFVSLLAREDRDTLSSYGSFHYAQAGETIIHQGESHGKLFFVISGLLHAVCTEDGRDILLGSIRQGDWIGEVDLFDPGSAVCSVRVIETTQYWVITRPDLEDYFNNYPEAGIQLMIGLATMLSQRLRGVTHKLMEESEMAILRSLLTGHGTE